MKTILFSNSIFSEKGQATFESMASLSVLILVTLGLLSCLGFWIVQSALREELRETLVCEKSVFLHQSASVCLLRFKKIVDQIPGLRLVQVRKLQPPFVEVVLSAWGHTVRVHASI